MARLRFYHIAGKESWSDYNDATGRICDYCHKKKIEHGDEYWHIVDGFGDIQCKDCYIKELEKNILDIDWIKERNKKITDEIKELKEE